jgi:hypothetical protein
MAAQPTLPNSMTSKKTTPMVIHQRVLNLKKRCMVDKTEVEAAMVVATENMAVVVASNIQVLKFPLLRKDKILICFLIILGSK